MCQKLKRQLIRSAGTRSVHATSAARDGCQTLPCSDSVAELQDDLSRFLNRQPILARRERWHESAGRLALKYPLVTGLTTASAFLLITVTVVSLVFAKSMMDANVRIRESEVVAKLGQAKALVSGAHGIRVTHEPGQRKPKRGAGQKPSSMPTGYSSGSPILDFDCSAPSGTTTIRVSHDLSKNAEKIKSEAKWSCK